jgi:hypothetical protein
VLFSVLTKESIKHVLLQSKVGIANKDNMQGTIRIRVVALVLVVLVF